MSKACGPNLPHQQTCYLCHQEKSQQKIDKLTWIMALIYYVAPGVELLFTYKTYNSKNEEKEPTKKCLVKDTF